MTLIFRYKKEVNRSKDHLPKYSPIIPITLKNGSNSIDVGALIDSGADTLVLPKHVGEILGIDLSGEREIVLGLCSEDIESVEIKLELIIQQKHESYHIPIRACVILNSRDDFNVLLGRVGFFNKENDKKVILKKVER